MEGEKEGHTDNNVVVAEFQIYMHCDACERIVTKTISKIKGVEQFVTDMINHRVQVTGQIKPEKVMKKLKKKTGKRVEILSNNQKDAKNLKGGEPELVTFEGFSGDFATPMVIGYGGGGRYSTSILYTMFSDENANTCSIM